MAVNVRWVDTKKNMVESLVLTQADTATGNGLVLSFDRSAGDLTTILDIDQTIYPYFIGGVLNPQNDIIGYENDPDDAFDDGVFGQYSVRGTNSGTLYLQIKNNTVIPLEIKTTIDFSEANSKLTVINGEIQSIDEIISSEGSYTWEIPVNWRNSSSTQGFKLCDVNLTSLMILPKPNN